MSSTSLTETTSTGLRAAVGLAALHLALSLTAVVVLVVEHDDSSVATTDGWVHAVIVAATAVLLVSFAVRAAAGDAGSLRRLRISSAVLVVALAVIAVLPGAFPVWMRVLEAASVVCLLGLLWIVATVRSQDARRGRGHPRP